MKKIDLDKAFSRIASLAVIAGIVFLAVELRQNNDMMRAQTRNDIAQSVVDLLRDIADTELLEIQIRAREGLTELTEIEAAKLFYGYQIQFRTWENIHYQYRMGLFDDAEFEAERRVWAQSMQGSVGISVWCGSREIMSPAFRREIDAFLPDSGCTGAGSQD